MYRARFAVGSSASQAFIWDAQHGLRRVKDLLTADGINLTGWNLTGAVGISDDGQTILGYGTNPTGATVPWIATLPEPSSMIVVVVGCVGLLRRARRAEESPAAGLRESPVCGCNECFPIALPNLRRTCAGPRLSRSLG